MSIVVDVFAVLGAVAIGALIACYVMAHLSEWIGRGE